MNVEALEFIRLLFLRNEIGSERLDECYYDVDLKIGSEVFPCHRWVLISNSPFFEILFSGNFKEASERTILLPAEYVNSKSFPKLLNAMYGEPLQIEDDVESLIVSCSYLQLSQFMDECELYICKNCLTMNMSKLLVLPQLRERKSLYDSVMNYVCKNFSTINPKLIRIPFEVLERLLQREEMLIWSRSDAIKFSKVWMSHYQSERKKYRRTINYLLTPYRKFKKGPVVERCRRYMRSNFSPQDIVEFYSRSKLDDPLHVTSKEYICRNFSIVRDIEELKRISYQKFANLLSEPLLFDLEDSAFDVISFCDVWFKSDRQGRSMYYVKISSLIRPFRNFCWMCSDQDYGFTSDDEYSSDYDGMFSDIESYFSWGTDGVGWFDNAFCHFDLYNSDPEYFNSDDYDTDGELYY